MADRVAVLVGASRGLGLGLARVYLDRGWRVVATARDPDSAKGLRELQSLHDGRLHIEKLDVTAPGGSEALSRSLGGTEAELLFIVAGRSGHGDKAIHDVTAEEAAAEFVTNAWGPPAVAEALFGLMAPHGTVAFMTSVLGSLAQAGGSMELYSASKAALNMLGIAFSRRHPGHPVLLMHPGWVRTDMGGAKAPLDVETSATGMADTVDAFRAKPGIHYIDYRGRTLPW